jgi:hypothetical protein
MCGTVTDGVPHIPTAKMPNTWLVLTDDTRQASHYPTPPQSYASLHNPPAYDARWLPLTSEPIPAYVPPPTYHEVTGDEYGSGECYSPTDMIDHILDAPDNWSDLTQVVEDYAGVAIDWRWESHAAEDEEDQPDGDGKSPEEYRWNALSIEREIRNAETFRHELYHVVLCLQLEENETKRIEEIKRFRARIKQYIDELKVIRKEVLEQSNSDKTDQEDDILESAAHLMRHSDEY